MGGAVATKTRHIDPITLEVVQNALGSIVDEMALTIMRTAYSGVVRDALDYSTALCDRKGEMIAQGLTIVSHLGSFPSAVRSILSKYEGRLYQEDTFIMNDPYGSGGIHLPDIYVIKPIFVDGELEAFSCVVAHHTDVGGIVPGGNATHSTEIYQEGINIPTLKLYERGEPNEAIFEILAKNVRVPVKVLGDLRAEITGTVIGERGYIQLSRRYGARVLRDYSDELLDMSERLTREDIKNLPNGEYEHTSYVEGDDMLSEPVVIHVKVIIRDDSIHLDFTGSSPMVKAGINCPLVFTRSVAVGAVRAILDPSIPNAAGYFRAITLFAPEGSVVNSVLPAPCGARGITGFRIVDCVLGALANAVPERVPADGEGGNTLISIGGYTSGLEPFVSVEIVAGSRGGAPWGDGNEGVPHPMANMANTPVEMIEVELPIHVEEYAIVRDTGGAGLHRGAMALARQVRILSDDAALEIRSDKRRHLPFGLQGGKRGTPSLNVLNPGSHDEAILPTLASARLKRGDVVRHVTAGGGGWGDALLRDPELVRRDVVNERLTPAHAESEYGVKIDPDTLGVDHGATEALRKSMRDRAI
jgi:N-methylhydantoinase B